VAQTFEDGKTHSTEEVLIDNDGSLIGLGDATVAFGGASKTVSHPTVDITTPSGATTTLDNFGTITSVNAQPTSFGDFAIRAVGGSVSIDNEDLLPSKQFGRTTEAPLFRRRVGGPRMASITRPRVPSVSSK
jgi:hypothetical protein